MRKIEKLKNKINDGMKCLILDFSSVSHIDPSGISTIKIIAQSFQKLDITIYIAACTGKSTKSLNMRKLLISDKNDVACLQMLCFDITILIISMTIFLNVRPFNPRDQVLWKKWLFKFWYFLYEFFMLTRKTPCT